MYEGIYSTCIRSLCIFVDILMSVIRLFIFFNIKYEHGITLINKFRGIKREMIGHV